jgi:hypothetical protein
VRGERVKLRHLLVPISLATIGVGFVGAIAVRAVQLDPLPMVASVELVDTASAAPRTRLTTDITPAVDLDPFRPDRRKPAVRYAVPGDVVQTPAETPPQTAQRAIALAGTVTSLDGSSFAMVTIAGAPPRVVRIGQTVDGLTLKSVEQGKAVFRSANGDLVKLTVPKAGQ